MKRFRLSAFGLVVFGSTTLPLFSEEKAEVSFVDEIKPLPTEKCSHCHNRKTLPEVFNVETAKLVFTPLKTGQKVIVPGKPEESLFTTVLKSPVGHEKTMPMVGLRPTEKDIELLSRWIKEGATWPKGPVGRIRSPFYAIE